MSRCEGSNLGGTLDVDLAHLPFQSALSLATSRSWLEIDLDAIAGNIAQIRLVSDPGIELLLPVKADGYGHGAVEVAKVAAKAGVERFGVASLEEAMLLRRGGIDQRILLLTPPIGRELDQIVAFSLTPVIADLDVASRLDACARGEGIVHPVQIEVDTGMGRSGVSWREAMAFISKVNSLPGLTIEGIFSHFSSADEEDISFAMLQLERFRGVMRVVNEEMDSSFPVHMSNSSAALRIPETGMSVIRPGLFVYGVLPPHVRREESRLDPQPAMQFRSRVVFVKEVDTGDTVGYGRRFIASGKMKVATISAGYRDGLHYGLSNRGEVLVRGRRCPVLGNICMDMLMADVSGVEGVTLGDRVTLMGMDGRERISPEEIAEIVGTISYDVMTSIGNKVPRIYYTDGRPNKIVSFLGTWIRD